MDDEADGFKENGILGIGVLDFLRLGRLLGLIEDSLQALNQATFHCCIFCWGQKARRQRVQEVRPQILAPCSTRMNFSIHPSDTALSEPIELPSHSRGMTPVPPSFCQPFSEGVEGFAINGIAA